MFFVATFTRPNVWFREGLDEMENIFGEANFFRHTDVGGGDISCIPIFHFNFILRLQQQNDNKMTTKCCCGLEKKIT